MWGEEGSPNGVRVTPGSSQESTSGGLGETRRDASDQIWVDIVP